MLVNAANETDGAQRRQLLERELERYSELLTAQPEGPERIILFGSLATGEVHANSDIDLVIVEEADLPFLQRLRAMRRLLKPQVGTDLLVYTPNEFEALQQERSYVRDEIVKKGRVLYARAG